MYVGSPAAVELVANRGGFGGAPDPQNYLFVCTTLNGFDFDLKGDTYCAKGCKVGASGKHDFCQV